MYTHPCLFKNRDEIRLPVVKLDLLKRSICLEFELLWCVHGWKSRDVVSLGTDFLTAKYLMLIASPSRKFRITV